MKIGLKNGLLERDLDFKLIYQSENRCEPATYSNFIEPNKIKKLYQYFLFYKNFFSIQFMLFLFHLVPLQSLSSSSSFSFNLPPTTAFQARRWLVSLLHNPSSFYGDSSEFSEYIFLLFFKKIFIVTGAKLRAGSFMRRVYITVSATGTSLNAPILPATN